MALLLTLVILMLLSIFMVEFSFQTTLETRGIRNFQASFQARNAVKSMLKAVLEGLQTRNNFLSSGSPISPGIKRIGWS